MLISNKCFSGLMPNLIKKSWTVSTPSLSLIIDQSTLSNLNGFDTPKKWQNISNDCYLTIGLALESIKNKEGQLVKLPLSDCNSLGTFSQQNSHSSKNLQKSPWKMTIRARSSFKYVPLEFGCWWYICTKFFYGCSQIIKESLISKFQNHMLVALLTKLIL